MLSKGFGSFNIRTHLGVIQTALAVLACCQTWTSICAQVAPDRLKLHIDVDVSGRAYDVLGEVHRQTGIGLIADAGSNQRDLHLKAAGTVAEVLNFVAETIDCRWENDKSGIILLRRRFQAPGEVPQANLKELRQTAVDALAGLGALGEYGDDSTWAPMLKRLAASLNPSQVASLESGQKLDSGALSASQRGMIQQAILSRTFGGLRTAWELFLSRLNGIELATLQVADLRGNAGTPQHRMCSLVIPGVPGPPVMLGELPVIERSVAGTVPNEKKQAKQGTPERKQSHLDLDAHVTIPSGEITLERLASSVSTQSGVLVEPHSSLRERRMLVAVSDVPAHDVLDALKSLYGWRWYVGFDKQVIITRPKTPLPRYPSEISGYLRAVLPADLRVFLDLSGPGDHAARVAETRRRVYADSGSSGLVPRQNAVAAKTLSSIAAAFSSEAVVNQAIHYAGLVRNDQELIRLMLAMLAFQNADEQVWYNEVGMQSMKQIDAKLWLDNHNEVLMVSRFIGDITTGFGANVRR